MAYISSVSFEVLVHGGNTQQFKPSRGLKQGDSLSSYLFILGQEILSRMLDHALESMMICGVKASIGDPAITYVMYADDIILFSKASRREADILSKCIDCYCNWSGQRVDINKFGIFFSKLT